MPVWNAEQYLKFADERTRPSRDLLAQVPLAEARHVVDLGCGPGNSTELLAERFPGARVSGVDSAPDMLAAARKRLPRATFEEADITGWTPSYQPDLIFAAAVFQWVPDHEHLFPRLLGLLAPGGVLAIQMPDNMDEPVHAEMRAAAAIGPWAPKLAAAVAGRGKLPPVGWYYDLLAPRCREVEVWHIGYNHALADVPAIVEWVKGTGLLPFVQPLEGDERAAFLAAYQQRLHAHYPTRADGKVLLAYPRLFIVART